MYKTTWIVIIKMFSHPTNPHLKINVGDIGNTELLYATFIRRFAQNLLLVYVIILEIVFKYAVTSLLFIIPPTLCDSAWQSDKLETLPNILIYGSRCFVAGSCVLEAQIVTLTLWLNTAPYI